MTAYKKEKPLAWMELMNNFEEAKCRYEPTPYSHETTIYVPMPSALVELLKEGFSEVYRRLSQKQGGILRDLALPRSKMDAMFAGVMEKIVKLVRKQFDRMDDLNRKCDYVFLVGGFASSSLLQERLQKEFGDKVKKIVIPPNPGVAVMVGACYYGLNPSQIKSRRSRMSYGIQLSLPFEEGKDLERQKGQGLESKRCPRRFWPLVKMGQDLPYNHRVSQRIRPIFSEAEVGVLPIYVSPRNEIRYTDDDGVRCLGQLEVQMPTADTEVEVSMFFGQTEFYVEARNLATGKAVAANFQYQHETLTSPFTVV